MIEDLKRLLMVIEVGSITTAAEKLYITQPALSQAIKRLERQLGIKMFRRNGKHLILTKNGSAFFLVIERIVQLWDGLKEKKNQTSKEICTIGVYDNAAVLLSSLFKKYYEKGEIDLEIIIDNSEKLFSQLIYGILDICICVYDQEKHTPRNCSLISRHSEKFLAVSSRQWNNSVEKIPFILYNRDSITRKYLDREFTKWSIQPTVIAESTSPLFIKELAILGSGVALLPESFVREEIQIGKLQEILLSLHFERTVGIYVNNDSSFSQIALFVDEIKSQLKFVVRSS